MNSQEVRSVSISILVQLWLSNREKIEEQEFKANSIIQMLGKASRDRSVVLALHALSYEFDLLQYFAETKNSYAPILYKSISVSLIENYSVPEIREFIMLNLVQVYSKIESIPVSIVVEPLIRQIQVSESASSLDMFDYDFFAYLINSSKLTLKLGVLLFDLLVKTYMGNIVYAPLVQPLIVTIVKKFSEDGTMVDLVNKSVKVSLAIFYSSERKKKAKEKLLPLYNNQSAIKAASGAGEELEQEIVQAQKRALIIQLLLSVSCLHVTAINERIRALVAHTHLQLKQHTKKDHKGLWRILQIFGDPQEILSKCENDLKDMTNLSNISYDHSQFLHNNSTSEGRLDKRGLQRPNATTNDNVKHNNSSFVSAHN